MRFGSGVSALRVHRRSLHHVVSSGTAAPPAEEEKPGPMGHRSQVAIGNHSRLNFFLTSVEMQ